MLQFKQDDTEASIILTLTEQATLPEPNYLFVFTHVTTKDVVPLILLNGDDLSNYAQRFNEFAINPSEVFAGYQPGEWHYQVYEQESAENTDLLAALTLLEQGKLLLDRSEEFAFDMYDSPTSYKTYNG